MVKHARHDDVETPAQDRDHAYVGDTHLAQDIRQGLVVFICTNPDLNRINGVSKMEFVLRHLETVNLFFQLLLLQLSFQVFDVPPCWPIAARISITVFASVLFNVS